MKSFEYVEGITAADYAIKAYGKNLNELFVNAGMGLVSTMVKAKTVGCTVKKELKLKNESIEKLLFEFLEEIIFLKDAEALMINNIKVDVKKTEKEYQLTAYLFGEELNLKKHELITDAKSITYHQYKVEKTPKGWEATFVVDV